MKRSEDPTKGIEKLTASLRPVLDLETSLGNTVKAVEVNVWTSCPLAVVMAQPLHFTEIAVKLSLPNDAIERWENRDPHYSVEQGLVCRATRHSIAGPISE